MRIAPRFLGLLTILFLNWPLVLPTSHETNLIPTYNAKAAEIANSRQQPLDDNPKRFLDKFWDITISDVVIALCTLALAVFTYFLVGIGNRQEGISEGQKETHGSAEDNHGELPEDCRSSFKIH